MSDERPNAYIEGDNLIIRASAFGSCPKALIAVASGYEPAPPPLAMLEKFQEGADAEYEILRAVSSRKGVTWRDGKAFPAAFNHLLPEVATSYARIESPAVLRTPHDGQFTIEWSPWPGTVVRGHMDSIMSCYMTGSDTFSIGDLVVGEAKKFGPDLWKKWTARNGGVKALPHYAMQVAIYMHATKLPALFIVGKREPITDIDEAREAGRDWKIGEVRVEHITTPPVPLGAILSKIRAVATAVEHKAIPETCDERDYPCPVFYLHGEATGEGSAGGAGGAGGADGAGGAGAIDLTGDVTGDAGPLRDELEALGAEYLAAAEAEKAAKAAKSAASKRIVEVLREVDDDVTKAITPGFAIARVHREWDAYEVKAGSSDYATVKARKVDPS